MSNLALSLPSVFPSFSFFRLFRLIITLFIALIIAFIIALIILFIIALFIALIIARHRQVSLLATSA